MGARCLLLAVLLLTVGVLSPPVPVSAQDGPAYDDILGAWEVSFDGDRDHVAAGVLISVTTSGQDAGGNPMYMATITDSRWHGCFTDGDVLWSDVRQFRITSSRAQYRAGGGIDSACEDASPDITLEHDDPVSLQVNSWVLTRPGAFTPDPDRIVGTWATYDGDLTIEINGQPNRYSGTVVAVGPDSCHEVGDQILPDLTFGLGVEGVAGNYRSADAVFGTTECVPGSEIGVNLIERADGTIGRIDIGRGREFHPRVVSLGPAEPVGDPGTGVLRPVDAQLARFRGHFGGLLGGNSSEVAWDGADMVLIIRQSPCFDETVVATITGARSTDDGVSATASFVPAPLDAKCATVDLGETPIRLTDRVERDPEKPGISTRFEDALLTIAPGLAPNQQTAVRTLNVFDVVTEAEQPGGGVDRRSHLQRVETFFESLLLTSGTSGGFAQAEALPVLLGTLGAFPDGLALAGVAGAREGVTLLLDPEDRALNQLLLDEVGLPVSEVVIAGGQAALPDAALPDLPDVPMRRIAGANRFETAAQLSAATFGPGVGTVYVATGANFPDALSGGAQAAREGAPILLVDGDRMPSSTDAELRRLAPQRIVVLGGTAVIPESMATLLAGYAPVERLAGPDRLSTAVEVSRASAGAVRGRVLTAPGGDYPDALVLASAAWIFDGPRLLLSDGAVPQVVLDEIARLQVNGIEHLGPSPSIDAVSQLTSVLTPE